MAKKEKNPAKRISYAELQILLARVIGAKPCGITTLTEVTMNKTAVIDGQKVSNPYYGRITKRCTSNVFIGFIYKNSVNRALVKEGKDAEFEPEMRKWGTRLQGTCLVEHNGNWYLECRFISSSTPEYFCDGQPIAKSEIQPYLRPAYSNAEHQGVDPENEIILRDYKVRSIVSITLNGQEYNPF
jgi:hypothetical protein